MQGVPWQIISFAPPVQFPCWPHQCVVDLRHSRQSTDIGAHFLSHYRLFGITVGTVYTLSGSSGCCLIPLRLVALTGACEGWRCDPVAWTGPRCPSSSSSLCLVAALLEQSSYRAWARGGLCLLVSTAEWNFYPNCLHLTYLSSSALSTWCTEPCQSCGSQAGSGRPSWWAP